MRCKVIAIGILWVFLLSGCAAIQREKIPAEPIFPYLKWNLASYAEFVKENMAEINANYSTEYTLYEFVVDTDFGSTVIQNLLDPESAAAVNLLSPGCAYISTSLTITITFWIPANGNRLKRSSEPKKATVKVYPCC